jgi:hypothetical protein
MKSKPGPARGISGEVPPESVIARDVKPETGTAELEDLDELLAKFEKGSKLLSAMVEIHGESLKTLKEMKKTAGNIAKHRTARNLLNDKIKVKKDLLRLRVLVGDIRNAFDSEALVAVELEGLLLGSPSATAPTPARTDKYSDNMEVV